MNILSIARQTIQLEADSLLGLLPFLDTSFEKAVELIVSNKGRLVISGIGKSAIIAQKMVATFNSTGTPALYLHAADAIHGDIGTIQTGDIVLIVSNSGNSPEIKTLVSLVKNFGNVLLAIVGNLQSFLAMQASIVLNASVKKEACPYNLAPTCSTTAQMVMGDALAVSLMRVRGFTGQDFAKYHPGGTLGRQLYLQVKDLLIHNAVPQVLPEASLKEVIVEMTAKRLGATAVVEQDGTILGIITDGDLRRMLEKNQSLNEVQARDICSHNPKTISRAVLALDALDMLRRFDISQLIVADNSKYTGILHLHDLVREGLL